MIKLRISWTIDWFNSFNAMPEIIPPNPIWLVSNLNNARVGWDTRFEFKTYLMILKTISFVSLDKLFTIKREYNPSIIFDSHKKSIIASVIIDDKSSNERIKSSNSWVITSFNTDNIAIVDKIAFKSFARIWIWIRYLIIP